MNGWRSLMVLALVSLGAVGSEGADVPNDAASPKIQLKTEEGKSRTWVTTFYTRVISADGKRSWIEKEDRSMAFRPPGMYRDTFLDGKGKERGYTVYDAVGKRELSVRPADKEATLTDGALMVKDPRGPSAGWEQVLLTKPVQLVETREAEGRKVNVYRHSMFDAANGRKWSYDFWVDPETQQCVRVQVPGADFFNPETDRDRDNAPEEKWSRREGLAFVEHEIKVGAALADSLFSMEAPEGFALKKVQRASVSEAQMIEYVGALAEFNDGQFPDQVIPFAISSDRMNTARSKPRDERTPGERKLLQMERRYMRQGINEMPLGHFLENQTEIGSFGYAGKGVKLGEKDRVVCWYRLRGQQQYRVIYADLGVKELAKTQLPQVRE